MFVSDHTAESTHVAGNDGHSIERPPGNRAQCFRRLVVGVAQPAIVSTFATMKIVVAIFRYEAIESFDS